MTVFPMPSLGADMEQGTLVGWLVRPGDPAARGDAVAVVETQKGAIEIESLTAGTVAELLARPGQTLPVRAPLARIETAGGAVAAPGVTATAPPPPARRDARAAGARPGPGGQAGPGLARRTPAGG